MDSARTPGRASLVDASQVGLGASGVQGLTMLYARGMAKMPPVEAMVSCPRCPTTVRVTILVNAVALATGRPDNDPAGSVDWAYTLGPVDLEPIRAHLRNRHRMVVEG